MNHPQAHQPHDDRHSEGVHAHSEALPLIVLPSSAEAIPAELRALTRWVCWRFEPEAPTAKNPNPKPRKVPVIAGTSSRASSTDPRQWRSFELAWRAASASNGTLGIGFVFAPEDGFCGVDLDDCRNEAGELSPEAKELIERFATYSEISPSGTGVKLIFKGTKPGFAGASVSDILGCRKVEVFDRARYFTITGQVFDSSLSVIADCQGQLDDLCNTLWPPKQTKELEQTWIQPVTSTPPRIDFSHIPIDKRESRCTNYLEKCPDAISGQGGHNATFRAACECFRFGLDDATVWRVMAWFNANKTGGEPWSEKDLRHKIDSARQKVESDGEFGARLVSTQPKNDSVWIDSDWSGVSVVPAENPEAYCPHINRWHN